MRPRWWAPPAAAAGCLVFVALGAALVASGGPGGVAIGVVSIAFFGGGRGARRAGLAHAAMTSAARNNAGMAEDALSKEEIRSAIEARRELGEEMEPAVVEAFVARIERRLAERAEQSERALERRRAHQKEMVLGSMGISVPLFIVAAIFTGLPGVIVVCVALVAIAVVSSRS